MEIQIFQIVQQDHTNEYNMVPIKMAILYNKFKNMYRSIIYDCIFIILIKIYLFIKQTFQRGLKSSSSIVLSHLLTADMAL